MKGDVNVSKELGFKLLSDSTMTDEDLRIVFGIISKLTYGTIKCPSMLTIRDEFEFSLSVVESAYQKFEKLGLLNISECSVNPSYFWYGDIEKVDDAISMWDKL